MSTAHRAPISATELLCVIEKWSISAAADTYTRTAPWLKSLARRHAPSLASDLHDEIVDETWHLALSRGADAFRASKADADAYLSMVLRNAVEVVKANNRPAGTKSRADAAAMNRVAAEFTDGVENWASRAWFEIEQAELLLRLDLERLASTSEKPVATALALMADEGMTMTEAASSVGMSRQALSRRLTGLRRVA